MTHEIAGPIPLRWCWVTRWYREVLRAHGRRPRVAQWRFGESAAF